MIEHSKARARWEELARFRSQILTRAEEAAAITIPSILPPSGHSEGSKLPQPYQSLGAKAVNTLSAKILLALFPPNTSFFKLNFDDLTRAQLQGDGNDLDAIQKDLSMIEQAVVAELEQTKLRPTMSQCAKHLIVTGNYVVDVMPSMNFRGFGLKHYVVNRDPEGSVIELVIKEEVSPLTLTDEVLDACFSVNERAEFSTSPEKDVDIFTVMQRVEGKFAVFQEVNGNLIPGSEGTYPLDAPRFVVLRWSSITDEDYGRGLVDEYYGDIKALDDMSRDLLVASANAAKIVYTVDPNSYIKPKMLADAQSGDVLRGRSEEVGTVSLEKLHDFNIVLERLRDIQRDLAEAFLMNTSVQRDAERVTAEEIRFMAQELEDALGGVYSVLAQEMQVPLLRRVLKLLGSKGTLPKLPKAVMISITTGLDALGRGHEVNKLFQFISAARDMIGEQQLMMRLDIQGLLNKLAAGLGVDTEGTVLTEDEVQAQMQQTQAQQMVQGAAPGVAQELVKQGGLPNG